MIWCVCDVNSVFDVYLFLLLLTDLITPISCLPVSCRGKLLLFVKRELADETVKDILLVRSVPKGVIGPDLIGGKLQRKFVEYAVDSLWTTQVLCRLLFFFSSFFFLSFFFFFLSFLFFFSFLLNVRLGLKSDLLDVL